MQVMQTIKENQWQILLGSSGTIITLVATLFTLDARYAHAADVAKESQQIHLAVKSAVSNLRKQNLEDKLFELDIKKEQAPNQRLSPIDSALAARYKRQLEEIVQKKDNN